MTYNLKDFRFTVFGDKVTKEEILVDTSVNALGGSDKIKGTSTTNAAAGLEIRQTGTLDASNGDDLIWGASSVAYNHNSPPVDLHGIGILVSGQIYTGFGDDTIKGEVASESSEPTYNRGIYVQSGGVIDTGFGNDNVTGLSGPNGYGIYNESGGLIQTGSGRDRVTGNGGRGYGIYNDGLIDTGADDDVLSATAEGKGNDFTGNGQANLGPGNDKVEGFGSGYFDGGVGKDRLLFRTAGTYSISSAATNGYYAVTLSTSDDPATTMYVKNFELIGAVGGGTQAFTPGGSFTIS